MHRLYALVFSVVLQVEFLKDLTHCVVIFFTTFQLLLVNKIFETATTTAQAGNADGGAGAMVIVRTRELPKYIQSRYHEE
jgi:hypothetical protein